MSVRITTPRLVLRPYTDADLDRLCELVNDRRVYATTLRIPYPYKRADAEAWLAKIADPGDNVVLVIADVERGELIGGIGLEVRREHDRAELGYWVGAPYWGRGYATEAAQALIDHGFGELGLERIEAGHLPGNEASARVLQKVGMTHEGVLCHKFKKDGVYLNEVMYAILRADWHDIRARSQEHG